MVWHDKPICLNYSLEAGDIITFYSKWQLCRGDYGYLEKIGKQKDRIKRMQREDKVFRGIVRKDRK